MKKAFSLFVVCLLTLSFFTACSQKAEEKPDPAQEEPTVHDFFEREFQITSCYEGTLFGYETSTVYADALADKIGKFQQDYNCTIETSIVTYDKIKDAMAASIGTGLPFSDQLYGTDESLKNVMGGGYLEPVENYTEFIDLKDHEKWGSLDLLETVMYKGTLYALHTELWPIHFINFYTPVIFNSKLMKEVGYDDPREYYENGNWTREQFTEMVDISSASESCTYGLSTSKLFFYQTALLANNANLFEKNQEGTYVSAVNSQPFTEALDWCYSFLQDHAEAITTGRTWDEMNASFYAQQTAMILYPTWGIFGGFDRDIEWGLLPFPNGPYREQGDWACYLDGNSFFAAVPLDAEDLDEISFFMNEFYGCFDEYPTKEALMDSYRSNQFFDERDFNLFFSMAKTASYGYWYEGGNPIAQHLNANEDTPAAAVEKTLETVQKLLDDYIIPNKIGMDQLRSTLGES